MGRFFGNDMTVFQKDADGNPVKSDIADIFPLAGILNPDAFSQLTEKAEYTVTESTVEESYFEDQAQQLEEEGLLTEIDVLTNAAEEKSKNKPIDDDLPFGVTVDVDS